MLLGMTGWAKSDVAGCLSLHSMSLRRVALWELRGLGASCRGGLYFRR